MTIAIGGIRASLPTAQYKIQFNGDVLPGYVQSYDDPGGFRIAESNAVGGDGSTRRTHGAASRTVTVTLRVLSRLGTDASGRAHFDDCEAQYRDALAIAARAQDNASNLYIGDSDRYLPASLESWSSPRHAPEHRRADYTLTFKTDSWYRSTSSATGSRSGISESRLTGVASGTHSFVTGKYHSGLLSDANAEFLVLPGLNNVQQNRGSAVLWMRPQYPSTNNTTSHVFLRGEGDTDVWDAMWLASTQRFVISGSGAAGAKSYAVAPAVTFASGNNVFFGMTWSDEATTIYAGVEGGALVSGTNAQGLHEFVTQPENLVVGGTDTSYSNAVLTEFITFSTELSADQMAYLFESAVTYDPLDDELPASMLLHHPLQSTVADDDSNGIYIDVGATRTTYPIVTLTGNGSIAIGMDETEKQIVFSGSAYDLVIDAGRLTAVQDEVSKIALIQNVNFGLTVEGNRRVGFRVVDVTGTFDASVSIPSRYER
jgi:hypothetical protein